jgi:hypothetical protein
LRAIAAASLSKNITLSHHTAAMDHYWTRQRAIDATVAFVALAATELGRGYHRPFIVGCSRAKALGTVP